MWVKAWWYINELITFFLMHQNIFPSERTHLPAVQWHFLETLSFFFLIMHFIFGKDLWKLQDLNQSELNPFHHWISLLFKWIVWIKLCYFWTTSNATILALNLLLDTFRNIWSESILASASQTTCIECTLCIITEQHPTCLLDSLQEKKNWHFPLSEQRWHHLNPLCCCNLCNRVKMRSSSLMIWTRTRARRPVRLHPGILTFSLFLLFWE